MQCLGTTNTARLVEVAHAPEGLRMLADSLVDSTEQERTVAVDTAQDSRPISTVAGRSAE